MIKLSFFVIYSNHNFSIIIINYEFEYIYITSVWTWILFFNKKDEQN